MTQLLSKGGRRGDRQPQPISNGFTELGISEAMARVLARAGIDTPFPIQTMTIPEALAGRDICGKARTGSGKTLAFGLPLVERTAKSAPRRPESLVLVPTRELATQVAQEIQDVAAARGLSLLAIYGGTSIERQARALRIGVDIVIATPGRLNDLLERRELSVARVSMVVLDEADQMADMGFMPQVERILSQIEEEHQTLLFSATLDGAVDRLVKRYQHDPIFHEVEVPEEDIPAMKHRFIGVDDAERVAVSADISAGPERTLLFVRTQRGAKRLVQQLANEGVEASMLHGGMSQGQRERSLQLFKTKRNAVLVATNVAARGIHVDGVEIVVHHDPPEDAKTYVHRSGRTARAGAEGIVVTLVSPDQRREVDYLRRTAGIREVIVPMHPGDERLTDLAAWTPPTEEPRAAGPAPDARPAAPRRNRASFGNGPRRPNNAPRGPQGGNARAWRREPQPTR